MFSKTAEYALRATIYIAQKSRDEKKVGIQEIAKAIDAPRSFTAKILQQLVKNKKILNSVTGPNGGFFISQEALDLPVILVLRSVKEEQQLSRCILGLQHCSDTTPCPLHENYRHIRKRLIHIFETTTIRKLAENSSRRYLFINNRNIKEK